MKPGLKSHMQIISKILKKYWCTGIMYEPSNAHFSGEPSRPRLQFVNLGGYRVISSHSTYLFCFLV